MIGVVEEGGKANIKIAVMKKNKIMTFAITWIETEIIILTGVRQKKKDKYHMILVVRGI